MCCKAMQRCAMINASQCSRSARKDHAMARDDRDLQDIGAERPRGRTDRLEGGRSPAGEPINPQWRSTRTSGRNRAVRSIPTSGQDFALWLQFGGWRFVLAVGAIVVVIALLIILTGQPAADPLAGGEVE